jgi:hypothetical protein
VFRATRFGRRTPNQAPSARIQTASVSHFRCPLARAQAREAFFFDACALVHMCVAETVCWANMSNGRFAEFDMVLLFAGKMRAAVEGCKVGLRVGVFEIERDDWEDANTLLGCLYMTWLVYSCKRGALVWASPECKTMLHFLSRSTFKRLTQGFTILGDDRHTPVKHGNLYSVFLSWLLFLSHARGVYWATENPVNSLLWQIPWFGELCLTCKAHRFCTSLGSFGGESAKCIEVYTTLPAHLCTQFLKRKATRNRCRMRLTKRSAGWTNGKHRALKVSAGYPVHFAKAIVTIAHVVSPGPRLGRANAGFVRECQDNFNVSADELVFE